MEGLCDMFQTSDAQLIKESTIKLPGDKTIRIFEIDSS